ncbi:hypothetical protein VP01_5943g1 [Puccinia sorghi]|uniref:Uncharacterized protein n=1 Tax=Puccinia sorghi TaxID=27349 RepID=A0A0L6UHM1_9BASI|nr:hypothetical protein VP01_5943g1 [Puccinia sorghi]
MAAFFAEKEKTCLHKEQEQEMAKLLKDQEHGYQSSRQRSCRSAQSQSKSNEFEDWGKSFSPDNYNSAMTYLEDSKNYTALFGDSLKTLVFATWLNQLNRSLLLNGKRLCLKRIQGWESKMTMVLKHYTICLRENIHVIIDLMHCSVTTQMSHPYLNLTIVERKTSSAGN